LRAILEEQRERVRELERETGRIISDVFVSPNGGRIKNFRKSWASATRAAGVPGRLVHDLRRTAVRNLERAGVPRSAAMAMTGHRSETIYRRYAIVEETMLQEASLKLAALHLSESSQSRVKVTPLSGR
jgi:integrase